MFEARLPEASIMKKLLDAITSVIDDGLLEVSGKGLSLQAMDSSHVALVSMCMKADAFEPFICDRNLSLGIAFKQ